MPRKKQGLRSYHRKSRHGCLQCKQRRVKCNMQSPACAHCTRRKECCEYPINQYGSLQWQSTTSNSLIKHATNVTSFTINESGQDRWFCPLPEPIIGYVRTKEHVQSHFSQLVESILSRSWFGSTETTLWSSALVQSAIKYPFMQHCIISLVYLRQDLVGRFVGDIPRPAYHHQITASNLFRQEPAVITSENWIAIIAFNIFMLVFQFATQSSCLDVDFNVVQTMKVLRDSHAIEEQALAYISKTKFWNYVSTRTALDDCEVDEQLRRNLQVLAEVISECAQNSQDTTNYDQFKVNHKACIELGEWVSSCSAHPRRWSHYCHWPAKVGPEFLDLLDGHDDVALLLVLHWCALLYRSPNPSVTSWARRTALDVIQGLRDRAKWETLLSWPLEILHEPLDDLTYFERQLKDVQLADEIIKDQTASVFNLSDSKNQTTATSSNSPRVLSLPDTADNTSAARDEDISGPCSISGVAVKPVSPSTYSTSDDNTFSAYSSMEPPPFTIFGAEFESNESSVFTNSNVSGNSTLQPGDPEW